MNYQPQKKMAFFTSLRGENMINLFNMDIDQIKHNNDYVILMKLNGDIVYENIGYCVEYTVEPIAFPLNSEDSYGEYYCLPRFYTQSNIYSPRYDYEKIKIIKKEATVKSLIPKIHK